MVSSPSRGAGYHQIAAELRHAVHRGEYPPGGLLPSEAHLAYQFGCSRDTIRDALAVLEREGMIVKQRGERTTICEPAHRTPIPLPTGAAVTARPATQPEIDTHGWPVGVAVLEVRTSTGDSVCYRGDQYELTTPDD